MRLAASAEGTSHNSISRLATASMCPFGENAIERIAPLTLVLIVPPGLGEVASSGRLHSRMVPSRLAIAKMRPVGANATAAEGSEEPPTRGLSWTGLVRSEMFHNCTPPLAYPAASLVPSGKNATDNRRLPVSVSTGPWRVGLVGSDTSQRANAAAGGTPS